MLICTPAECADPAQSGTFSFPCGTLPANALCLFNPATESLNAGVQGNVMVEISTGNGSTVRLEKPDAAKPDRVKPGPGRLAFWRALPLACGLLLLPLAVRRRRKIFLLAVLLAILAGGIIQLHQLRRRHGRYRRPGRRFRHADWAPTRFPSPSRPPASRSR